MSMRSTFSAILLDIKDVKKVPAEFRAYVDFKIAHEGREIRGDERVAIFNIADTSSYAVIFLDPGKTIADIDGEMRRLYSASVHPASKEALKRALG